jgi:tetratricopeptide (TPR) repeat protein
MKIVKRNSANNWFLILIVLGIVFSSCKTSFRISVVSPPAVQLSPETVKILIINNVTHDNSPDKLILQALQGQPINGNVMASEQCVIGLSRSFNDSRYLNGLAINPIVLRNEKEINWIRIDSLCMAHGAHAILEIESFQSQAPVGGTVLANATGQISSPLRGWGYFNLFVPATREHLYKLEVGEVYNMPISGNVNPILILNDMMRKRELYGHLGRSVGYSAGLLFYPHWVWVGRSYFNKGHALLRRAKRPIRFGNWQVAEQILTLAINNPKNKVAGRAKHNMALVYEGQGRLEEAIAMAERAVVENGNRLAPNYISILRRRINAQPRIVLLQDR